VPVEAGANGAVPVEDPVGVRQIGIPGDVVGGRLGGGANELAEVAIGGPAASRQGVDRLVDMRPVESVVGGDDARNRDRPQRFGGVGQGAAALFDLRDAPLGGDGERLVELELGGAEDLLLALED
jgi:hypothetical protein